MIQVCEGSACERVAQSRACVVASIANGSCLCFQPPQEFTAGAREGSRRGLTVRRDKGQSCRERGRKKINKNEEESGQGVIVRVDWKGERRSTKSNY